MTISELWTALKIGKEIKNPATWKNRQSAINAIVGIIAFVIGVLQSAGINIQIAPDSQAQAAGAIVVIVGFVNIVLTAITSKKVGLPVTK